MAEDLFVVDRDELFWGTLSSVKPVNVLDFIDGGALAPEVLVSEQAMVTGDKIATKVTVFSQVLDNIFADQLVLQAASNVEGEIDYKTLELHAYPHNSGTI